MDVTEFLVPLGFFAAIVLSLYYYYKSRNAERMALIEKGQFFERPKSERKNLGYKVGTFLIGISLGIFLGYLLAQYSSIHNVIAFFTMILLFGGLSLMLNNYMSNKYELTEK